MTTKKENTIAFVLKIIALAIYVIGAIVGLMAGAYELLEVLLIWAKAAILGTVFLGFAEVIKLLEDIKRK